MEKKTVYYFKNLLTFLNNKDSLPKLSFSLIEETGLFYVNGQFFSENTLFNLNQLLENVTGELSEKDTTNEAVIKLYKLILEVNLDANNLIKLLVSEIYDLRETTNERMDKTDKIVASGLSLHNDEIDKLKTTVEDHLDNKDLQHIPEGGHERQILAWQADGKAKWDDLANMFTGLEELLAYGVEWDVNVADPHITRIGNMSLHKTLPIQSQLKGCIAQKDKVIYWLNEEDWRFRKNPTFLEVSNLAYSYVMTEPAEGLEAVETDEVESTTMTVTSLAGIAVNQYIRAGGVKAKIIATDAEQLTITIDAEIPEYTGMVELGSRLDGYDGTVRVYCPNFYIKSQIIGDTRRVWLSTVKIDNTWTYQPEILIDAYRSTVLNTVPEDMGYLSTLPVNSAISVVNTATYCRGGGDGTYNDTYLKTDPNRSNLGKPRTFATRSEMRTWARNAGSEMLSYEQYKNIFYWLYVVEYANFNCQATYNEELTADGYRQGGLGDGVTTWNYSNWSSYNGLDPLTPCGFGNDLGNHTGVKDLVIPETVVNETTTVASKTFKMPRWRGFDNPFGDILTNLDGIIIDPDAASHHPDYMSHVYTTDNPAKYGDTVADIANMRLAGLEVPKDGYIKEFDLGTTGEIIPKVWGGSITTYKCDYHPNNDWGKDLRTLFVGGSARNGGNAGFGYFNPSYGAYSPSSEIGFRTVNVL